MPTYSIEELNNLNHGQQTKVDCKELSKNPSKRSRRKKQAPHKNSCFFCGNRLPPNSPPQPIMIPCYPVPWDFSNHKEKKPGKPRFVYNPNVPNKSNPYSCTGFYPTDDGETIASSDIQIELPK